MVTRNYEVSYFMIKRYSSNSFITYNVIKNMCLLNVLYVRSPHIFVHMEHKFSICHFTYFAFTLTFAFAFVVVNLTFHMFFDTYSLLPYSITIYCPNKISQFALLKTPILGNL